MGFKDYYKILGIKNVKVSQDEIKNAYRMQAKKYHPDLNITNSSEIIQDINEAYQVLSDVEKKKKYDKLWINYVGKKQKENITYSNELKFKSIKDELKRIFFGDNFGFNLKEKNENTESNKEVIRFSLTVEEAYLGTTKILKYNNKEYNIVIPRNSKNRDLIVIKNIRVKDIKKTLILEINILPKDNLRVDFLDITDVIELSPEEAVLGTTLEYDFMNERISIKIPKGCQNGKKIIVKNKGFKTKERKGNLVLEILVKIPTKITEKQKKLYMELLETKNEKQQNRK